MKERDLRTIILNETNKNNASSYKYLVNILTSGFNIPFFPNMVAL